jgi:hypothetical protein
MSDEQKTETVTEVKPAEKVAEQPTETIESLKLKLADAERKAANKTEEAERHFKKLSKFEEQEKLIKEAQLSDIEKANKKAAELEVKVKQLETNQLKLSIAAKIGLPESLALRLQGETPADIEADAKAILETLPKKPAATGSPTNPGGGSQPVETDAERRKRLGI